MLIAGGYDDIVGLSKDEELYDPATETWTVTASLPRAKTNHTTTLLPNGKVLLAAGFGILDCNCGKGIVDSAELYDIGLDFDDSWRPQIARARFNKNLRLSGSLFQGVSQASGGNTQDSSSNYPIVQLHRIDNDQIVLFPVDPRRGWSDTSFTSLRSQNVPPGPSLVTVFTNGIPSDSMYLVVPATRN